MREYVRTVEGFIIYFEAVAEDIPAEEVFSFKQTGVDYSKLIKKIQNGEEEYFCAKVTAVEASTNITRGTAFLGCCVYTPARSFLTESGYLEQMISEAVEEAKANSK